MSGTPALTPPPDESSGNDALRALARLEHRMLRLTFWQTMLSLTGAAIAIVALYAALAESREVRRQTAAAVWPFVQLKVSDHLNEDDAGFRISLSNVGVGPARVRALRLAIEGQAVANWESAIAALELPDSHAFSRDFIGNRVLSPDETVNIFDTDDPALVRRMRAAAADPATGMTFCYCSIFDDCFVADSRTPANDPAPVDVCPSFGADAFSG